MNRLHISLIAVTCAACAAFYLARSSRIAAMETALAEKRAIVSKLEASGSTPATRGRDSGDGAISLQEAADRTAAIIKAHGDQPLARAAFITAFNDLLDQIGDLPPAELLALADTIDAPFTVGKLEREKAREEDFKRYERLLRSGQDPDDPLALADKVDVPLSGETLPFAGRIKQCLLMLAAQHDAAALLARPEVAQDPDLGPRVIASLGSEDPAAALRWVETSGLAGAERDDMLRAAIRGISYADFREGLRIANEHGMGGDTLNPLASDHPLRQSVIDNAAAALSDTQDKNTRNEIVQQVLTAAAFYSGVEGMKEIAARHAIPQAELAWNFDSHYGQRALCGADPVQALAWFDEVLDDEQLKTAVPEMMGIWAERNFNAAGSYLGKMPPSEVKNLAIASFVTTVAPLDAPTAALWALEIFDAEQRKAAIGEVMEQWRDTDPQAADAWLKQQDLTNAGY